MRSFRALSVLVALLVSSVGVMVTADSTELVHQSISRAILEAKINEVESAPDLDEESRRQLTELYLKSISNLEAYASHHEAIREYTDSIDNAPALTAALIREIERLRNQTYKPALNFNQWTSTTDIAQELLQVRANLSAAESDVRRMQMTLEQEQGRLSEARQQLSSLSAQQIDQSTGSGNAEQTGDAPQTEQALAWLRQTADQAQGSEIKMLDRELLSHAPRMAFLKAQLARREITVERLKQDVAAIEAVLGERRQVEADEAITAAQRAQYEAEGKDPLLIAVATENARISTRLLARANAIEKQSVGALAVEDQVKALEESFRGVRQKLEVAGMNRALGRILQDQRSELPKQRAIKAELKSKEALISDITLDQLVIDEQLKALSDPEDMAHALFEESRLKWSAERREIDVSTSDQAASAEDSSGDGAESSVPRIEMTEDEIIAELITLLHQRNDLYLKLESVNSSYLQALSDLEFAQRRLLDIVEAYDSFLSERLLWVRSVANPTFSNMLMSSGQIVERFNTPERQHTLELILKVNVLTPVMVLGLLVALLLIRRRSSLHERLLLTNRYLGNPVKDQFSYTLQSLGYSLLLSVPGPLIVLSVGVKLVGSLDHSALAQAMANGLLWLSLHWFFFLIFYQICCPEGLGHRHFRWHEPALKPLRQEVLLLMLVYLPIAFLTVVSIDLDSSAMEWSGVQLLLILSMLTFAGFFLRVLRLNGRVMRSLYYSKAGVLLVRMRWIWITLSVLIPMVLVGLTTIGYVYTASQLMDSFVRSFWVVILLVLVHQLCVRWLTMTARKLNYKALQSEHQRELDEELAGGLHAGEMSINPDEESLQNVALLGRDSLKLVNILTGILAVFGFLVVWSDVLPALGYLNNIQLWDSVSNIEGEAVLKSITIADFGLSVLTVAITFFMYRNLPSLMELFLMQVVRMPPATRYTVITLTRYILFTGCVFYVGSLMGFEWAKFQWLVAALGVGIGFGLQEIVANFISGLIILFERPIRVGDRVTVANIEGNVSRIRIRATTIQTWDRQELLVPNKEFITGTLLNWSLSDQISRLVVNVGIAYGSDVERAIAIVTQIAHDDEKVLAEPEAFVTFEEFGDNTLNLCLRCFLDDMEARLVTRSRLNLKINRAFEEAGIVVAFPQLDVHFDEDTPLNIQVQK